MYDISSQLAMKLARHGPSTPVLTSDDFTRLALDTIALCSMGYRFNSFYHDDIHPFVQAMSDFLVECQNRNKRPSFVPDFMYRRSNEKFWADIATMRKTADDVVGSRRENPSDRKDLLTAMLTGVDPRTGERLTDDNITDQLITFLIAGHETTSGLLCFSFYNLLKHPEAYRKVQQEVDEVVGLKPIRQAHIPKFPYIAAVCSSPLPLEIPGQLTEEKVLRETLRLSSTIPAFALEPYEDTLLAGKYAVAKGEPIQCLLARAHLDPVVFGDDAKEFKPERMLEDNFARLNKEFPNCWKPFGNGKRGCIGRPFAWQEAILCVAMLFQNFNFVMDDPNYQLQIVKTLTIKPGGFRIRASMRHGMTPTELEQRLAGQEAPAESEEQVPRKHSVNGTTPPISRKPMAIYYGSNSGTCEAMAQRVAADAPHHGFSASTISPLDSAYQNLTKDRPVVIVTASYEGKPPSNAGLFVSWLESLRGKELEGVNYAVYGCGHRDWIDTFHRIPKLVDSTVEKQGGYRLVPLSVTDAADRDMFSDFEAWEDELLWPVLKEKYGTSEDTDASTGAISVEVSVPRKHVLRQDVEEAMVLSQKTLTTPSAPAKKHVEIQLPTGMRYKPGDYLAVLPLNPRDNVSRVLRRFELPWDASLRITADIPTTLPTDKDISAVDALSAYVELSQPATKRVSALTPDFSTLN